MHIKEEEHWHSWKQQGETLMATSMIIMHLVVTCCSLITVHDESI